MSYKTRRDLLLAERLAGYIAITVGASGSGVVWPGFLHKVLADVGDTLTWSLSFMICGFFMVFTSFYESYQRRKDREMLNSQLFHRISCWREAWHLVLGVCWAYSLVLLFNEETMIVTVVLQAPVMIGFHVRGAWENVKSRNIRRSEYTSVVDFACRRLGSRIRHSDGAS